MCILSDPEGRSPHGEDGDSRLHRSTGRSSGYGRSGESANQLLADRGHCLGIPKHLSTTLQTPLVVFIVPASGHNVDRLIYILNVVWQCSVCLSVCLSVSVFPVLTLPPPLPLRSTRRRCGPVYRAVCSLTSSRCCINCSTSWISPTPYVYYCTVP